MWRGFPLLALALDSGIRGQKALRSVFFLPNVLSMIIVALICIVFLLHARSALVAAITLPISILIAFIALRAFGIGADIMSLGGIAIAIGEMIDAAIVMVENMHKHLERRIPPGEQSIDTAMLTREDLRTVPPGSRVLAPTRDEMPSTESSSAGMEKAPTLLTS